MRECYIPRCLSKCFATSTMAFLIVLTAAPLWACNVPVFRYALEHWRSDPYQVVFFHRGELTPEQTAEIQRSLPLFLALRQNP